MLLCSLGVVTSYNEMIPRRRRGARSPSPSPHWGPAPRPAAPLLGRICCSFIHEVMDAIRASRTGQRGTHASLQSEGEGRQGGPDQCIINHRQFPAEMMCWVAAGPAGFQRGREGLRQPRAPSAPATRSAPLLGLRGPNWGRSGKTFRALKRDGMRKEEKRVFLVRVRAVLRNPSSASATGADPGFVQGGGKVVLFA